MKILIGLPTDNNLKSDFVSSLIGLLFHTYKHYNYEIHFETYFISGVRTDKNRNMIVDKFINENFDYLLFLDTDMIYPKETLVNYIESGKELMGGIYYKRSNPHYPVVYTFSDNPDIPFNAIDPLDFESGRIVEVDGIGTGGMFIAKSVFIKLKEAGLDPYFKYGDNYHLPYKTANQTTHDLVFCKKCREIGIQIYVHTDNKFKHITERFVDEEDWKKDREQEVTKKEYEEGLVDIICPNYGKDAINNIKEVCNTVFNNTAYHNYRLNMIIDGDPELAELVKKEEKLKDIPNIRFITSEKNLGFGGVVNEFIKESNAEYFVYIGNDVRMGEGWLTEAIRVHTQAFPEKDGIVVFNDGVWYGKMASHALVHRNFLKYTGSTLFYPGYKHYHVDRDLTMIAQRENKMAYAYNSVVYHLQAKSGRAKLNKSIKKAYDTEKQDLEIYKKREAEGFPKY